MQSKNVWLQVFVFLLVFDETLMILIKLSENTCWLYIYSPVQYNWHSYLTLVYFMAVLQLATKIVIIM